MIEIRQLDRVRHLSLNRPDKRNALNAELCQELVRAFDDADADNSTGAIVLSGNGPVFCAGMDLRDASHDPQRLSDLHERLFTVINRIQKPIVAAVQGAALAGGLGLVANGHIAIAAPETRFGLTEIRIGLWPVVVFRAVALAIGERRATELSLTGRIFSAEEAQCYGLLTEIADDPLARALSLASDLSQFSPAAIAEGLDYVHRIRGLGWDEAAALGHRTRDHLMAHPDFAEGTRAFLEKRPAVWPSLRPI